MRAKFLKEAFDYSTGGWFTPKKSAFERAREYSLRSDFKKELSDLIDKYRKEFNNDELLLKLINEISNNLK